MPDYSYLWLAVACYVASLLLTLRRLRARGPLTAMHRLNTVAMVIGYVLHTAFMYHRGHLLGRCPLTNLFEAQVFVSWALVVFYLVIGHSYRVSFLGAFTAPLVLGICLLALLFAPQIDVLRPKSAAGHSPWIEFHAAIAIVACGALALGAVCAAMYLVQQRQLKTRQLSPSFLLLPSIEQLDVIGYRLLLLGFAMLTVGMVGGQVSLALGGHWTMPKIVWATAVWALYGALLAARLGWSVRGRRFAIAVIGMFALVLCGYWVVSLVAAGAGPGA